MIKFVQAAIAAYICIFCAGCGEESPYPVLAVNTLYTLGAVPSGLHNRADAPKVASAPINMTSPSMPCQFAEKAY